MDETLTACMCTMAEGRWFPCQMQLTERMLCSFSAGRKIPSDFPSPVPALDAGMDRNALKLVDPALAQSALDGGADLPEVQDDRLIIEDAPLVEHMGVGSDCTVSAHSFRALDLPNGRRSADPDVLEGCREEP